MSNQDNKSGGENQTARSFDSDTLRGTPVGTPDGDVIWDSCNKQITSVRQLRDEESDDPNAHIYVTGDAHGWFLRWANCDECGPVGNGEPLEPGEAHSEVTFTTHPLRDIVLIDSVEITECSPLEEGMDR